MATSPARATPANQPATPTPPPPLCTFAPSVQAAPARVRLGQTVGVTVTVRAVCAPARSPGVPPLHVMLVVDRSMAMGGADGQQAIAGLKALVDRLALPRHAGREVGLVLVTDQVTIRALLTRNDAAVKAALDQFSPAIVPNPDIATGIGGARFALQQGQLGHPDPSSIREAMVVVAAGPDRASCAAVRSVAGSAQASGVTVIFACAGGGCDQRCHGQSASAPYLALPAVDPDALASWLKAVEGLGQLHALARTRVDASVVLDKSIRLVPASETPGAGVGAQGASLAWRDLMAARDTATYAFRVQPLKTGRLPVFREAWVQTAGLAPRGRIETHALAAPLVEVEP